MHSQPHPGARPRHAGPSQVPRPLSRYAPSPTTPESPTGAHACDFPVSAGFTISERLAALGCVTRLNRVRFRYGSHRPPHRCFRAPVARFTPPMRLHVSQAFHMVNSFQFTREVRLRLTHQSSRGMVGCPLLLCLSASLRELFLRIRYDPALRSKKVKPRSASASERRRGLSFSQQRVHPLIPRIRLIAAFLAGRAHPFTLSPSHPFTLSPFHPFTLSPFHPFTLSPFHPFTLSPFHPFTLSPFHPFTLSPFHPFTLSPFHPFTLSPFHPFTLSPFHPFTLSPRHPFTSPSPPPPAPPSARAPSARADRPRRG